MMWSFWWLQQQCGGVKAVNGFVEKENLLITN